MRSSRSAFLPSSNLFTPFLTLILCVLIFSAFSFAAAPDRITGAISSRQLVKLSAGVPKAQPKYDQGRVDPALKLNYMTLLTAPSPSQQKALNKLLADQQNPRSPLYHKWLTPEQYADRFGLSLNDIQKLSNWLQSGGFSVQSVARGRNWIVFGGTAAQAEAAFQTEIHNFDVNGKKHFANTSAISIPEALSGIVVGVRGLNNVRPKSYLERRTSNYTYTVSGNSFLYLAPGDIETIYDIGPLYSSGIDGTGQKLAVIGQTDVYPDDLTDFRNGFGLSAISGCTVNGNGVITVCNTTNFQYILVLPEGGADPGLPDSIGDDLPEADLDLEWSGATARNAQIVYVNAPDPNGNGVWDAWYHAVDSNVAPVITMSYGYCELGELQYQSITADEAELQKANTEGITFMNSSGDAGAAGCDPSGSPGLAVYGLAVSYPASSAEVTGVGGTATTIAEISTNASTYWYPSNDTNGNTNGGSAIGYVPEGAWNDEAEIGAFCAANLGNSTCIQDGIVDQLTAQLAFGIGSSGGGPSGCILPLDGNGDCTGGFAQPSWQTVTITGQASARFVPDVALMSSPNFPGYIWCTAQNEIGGGSTASTCTNGIADAIGTYGSIIGGTSAATPIFAGIVTLMNQYLVKSGVQSAPGLGNINPNLYQIAIANPTAFHQITASDYPANPGSNMVWCEPGTPGFQAPATGLNCPAAVPPANYGIFGYLSSSADAATGYNLVTGLGSVDANVLATKWQASKNTTSVSVTALPSQITYGQSVTLTATVSPWSYPNSSVGTVSFFNNGSDSYFANVKVNPATGVATYTTSNLPPGTDNITASYSGDLYNQPSPISAAAVVNVQAPTFTVSTPTTPSPAPAGELTNSTFVVTATGASTFAAAVTFACNGLPDTTINCGFSSIAAGASSPQTVTLTITTKGPNMAPEGKSGRRRADNRSPWLPLTLPLAGIVMVGLAGRKMSKYSAIAGLCVSLALLGLLLACGSSSAPPPISVSVSPEGATVFASGPTGSTWPPQTATFTATVTNTTNKAVNWAVATTNGGSITSAGVYTAPTAAEGLPGSATITATSQADPTKSGSATVTITPTSVPGSYPLTVTATEGPTQVTTGSFTLTVQ